MTWIIRQTLFCQNVEIENLPNFNDVKFLNIRYFMHNNFCGHYILRKVSQERFNFC